MVHYWQQKFYNSRYSSSIIKNPDFVLFARSCGINAIKCDNVNLLDKTLDLLINYKGPLLVHMIINDADCLPFVAPNKSLNEMIL